MYPDIIFPFNKNIHELSSTEAKSYFEWFIENIESRINILEHNVRKAKGYNNWKADYSIQSIQEIDGWFFENLAFKNEPAKMPKGLEGEFSWLKSYIIDNNLLGEKSFNNETYHQCYDVGIYFSEALIKDNNTLYRTFFTQPNYVHQNFPVVVNKNKKVRLEPFKIIRGVAGAYLNSKEEKGLILKRYNVWRNLFKK